MEVNGGEYVIMHSHSSIVHYSSTFSSSLEDEGLMQAHPVRHPMAVMRGFADIDKIESGKIELFTLKCIVLFCIAK